MNSALAAASLRLQRQMNRGIPSAFVLVAWLAAGSAAFSAAATKDKPAQEEIMAATRLQVFLDRNHFGPGKIDGRYGEFTRRALELFRASKGTPPDTKQQGAEAKEEPGAAPDVSDLDLASIDPPLISYTVVEGDLKFVGEAPESITGKAALKSLPYASAAEAVAEKFHCDVDYLKEVNPGMKEALKAGDTVQVPNVEPFDLAAVVDAAAKVAEKAEEKSGDDEAKSKSKSKADEKARSKSKQKGKGKDAEAAKAKADEEEAAPAVAVKIDTRTNMLEVHKDGKVTAAFPVTIGSEATETPVGEWQVQDITRMPFFRYDKKMLKEGERSDDFQVLPPGPNNLVGVMWIGLNKKGIGIHGTAEPDSIGRSSSHGCIRLANWDVVRLAEKVSAGTPVSIQ